jgi:HEAT repeat protein
MAAKAEPEKGLADSSPVPTSPETIEADNELLIALAEYPAADPKMRAEIEEHLAGLADQGVDKSVIARVLGSMFEMEKSPAIKMSILDELDALGGSFVLEQALAAVLPNQPLEVRDEAISILQDLGDNRAIPNLQSLLTDPDANIREAAREAIDVLNDSPEQNKRRASANILRTNTSR